MRKTTKLARTCDLKKTRRSVLVSWTTLGCPLYHLWRSHANLFSFDRLRYVFSFFCIIVFRWRRSDCVRCDMYRWNVFLWGTNVFTDFSQRVLLLYMFTFFSLSLILLSFVLFAAQGVWKKYCKKKLNVSYWKVSLSYVTRWYLLVFYVI